MEELKKKKLQEVKEKAQERPKWGQIGCKITQRRAESFSKQPRCTAVNHPDMPPTLFFSLAPRGPQAP